MARLTQKQVDRYRRLGFREGSLYEGKVTFGSWLMWLAVFIVGLIVVGGILASFGH